jgi:hypothetical protein
MRRRRRKEVKEAGNFGRALLILPWVDLLEG